MTAEKTSNALLDSITPFKHLIRVYKLNIQKIKKGIKKIKVTKEAYKLKWSIIKFVAAKNTTLLDMK